MTEPLPTGVVVTSDRNSISASIDVDAPAGVVFDFVRTPANHAAISGDGSVRETRKGPEALSKVGDSFGMDMKLFGVPYPMTSKVHEYEQDRLIAWAHPGGHRWRWTVEAVDEGSCRVTETFDLSMSPIRFALRAIGFPGRHRSNVAE